MRAGIYVRVSTKPQEAKKALDTQQGPCEKAAIAHGYEVDPRHVYREIHSGAELWDRPRLTELRDAIATGTLDAVFVYAVDRLSRDPTHLLIVLAEAERNGVEIRFVKDTIDNSDEGKLVQFVKGYAAKIEREAMKERTLRGKLAILRSGKLVGLGRDLYGYRLKDGVRVINEVQAATVRRIFEWAASGESIRWIARTLGEEGTPSPSGNAHWAKSTVSRILHEFAYAGRTYGWRWKREGTRVIERNRDAWIELPSDCTPAIVDLAMWEEVQAKLKRNQALAARNTRHLDRYLLRGYVRCGQCGYPMWTDTRRRNGRTEMSYRCRGNRGHVGSTCKAGARPCVSSSKLDTWAWDAVRGVLLDPDVIRREVDRLRERGPDSGQLELLDRARSRFARQEAGLIAAIAELGDAGAPSTRRRLLDELQKTAAKKDQIAAEARNEREIIARQRQGISDLDAVVDWCQHVATRLSTFSFDDKRLAIEAVGAEVLVFHTGGAKRAELTLRMPGKSKGVVMSTTC